MCNQCHDTMVFIIGKESQGVGLYWSAIDQAQLAIDIGCDEALCTLYPELPEEGILLVQIISHV